MQYTDMRAQRLIHLKVHKKWVYYKHQHKYIQSKGSNLKQIYAYMHKQSIAGLEISKDVQGLQPYTPTLTSTVNPTQEFIFKSHCFWARISTALSHRGTGGPEGPRRSWLTNTNMSLPPRTHRRKPEKTLRGMN